MTEERVRRLEALGIHWTSAFFRTRWEEMFAVAAAYFRKHGDLWMPPGYVTPEGKKLGVWVARQRSKRSGAGGSGALTREQERRLEEIGMVWDPYTEKWMEKYRLAEAFYRAHGHLKIPVGYVTEDGTKLGMWIASQRQAMRGNPNFLMTEERRRLLDAIGMDWTMRYTKPDARRRR